MQKGTLQASNKLPPIYVRVHPALMSVNAWADIFFPWRKKRHKEAKRVFSSLSSYLVFTSRVPIYLPLKRSKASIIQCVWTFVSAASPRYPCRICLSPVSEGVGGRTTTNIPDSTYYFCVLVHIDLLTVIHPSYRSVRYWITLDYFWRTEGRTEREREREKDG